jgi:hypothetical protein
MIWRVKAGLVALGTMGRYVLQWKGGGLTKTVNSSLCTSSDRSGGSLLGQASCKVDEAFLGFS